MRLMFVNFWILSDVSGMSLGVCKMVGSYPKSVVLTSMGYCQVISNRKDF